ncbi:MULTISPECIES: RDD family protein [Aquimarina]|uniref:RDD family protein n=1 Tax=Aquimarina TaxID=290174 RepID=UPI000D69D0A0|nr:MULTISPECIES: RDD family protein [Aquimarina]
MKMAGFGPRLIAILLDAFLISIIIIFIGSAVLKLFLGNVETLLSKLNGDELLMGVLFYCIGIPVLTILYQSLFESSKFQGTPGKVISNIKVVNYNGDKASFWFCILRNASRVLSSFFMIGYLMVFFTKEQQTLHDIISKTYVVKR